MLKFLFLLIFFISCSNKTVDTNFKLSGFQDRGDFSVTSVISDEPIPLVIVLHGYMANAWAQSAYLNLGSLLNQRKFHLTYLNGAKNIKGLRFWNASKACCDLFDQAVDDYDFIKTVISTIKEKLKVSKVYLVGHSNGGFMSYSFLCRHPELVDGIASLAGIESAPDCKENFKNKRVLHIHGTDDNVIKVSGGSYRGMLPHPSVDAMLSAWSKRLNCSKSQILVGQNFSSFIFGSDSKIHKYSCENNNNLSYFEIIKGSHIPLINDDLRHKIFSFLFD